MKKLKNKAGFTLTEMLVSMLIVLLVSALLVTCISAGAGIYAANTSSAQSEVLLGTITAAVTRELCYATQASAQGSNGVRYSFANSGAERTMRAADGIIVVSSGSLPKNLLSDKAYTQRVEGLEFALDGTSLEVKVKLASGFERTFYVDMVNLPKEGGA